MSRAVRRQQASAPKEGASPVKRPFGVRTPRQSRGAKPPTQAKRGFRPTAPRWAEEIMSELKKVSWPSRDETIYLTTVVIIVAVIVGLVLGSIDIFFNWFIDHLLLR